MIGPIIAVLIVAAVFSLITVIIIKTILFKAPPIKERKSDNIEVDIEKAVADLSEMIKCKTVSRVDKSEEDESEFIKFKTLLPRIFPNIYTKCEYEEVGNRALLYRYRGKTSENPTVLMSHFDVVPVVEDKWKKPPFDGVVDNGVLWGRGAIDTKVTLNGAMQALEKLISEGFVPEHDVYLAFAGDEEINGTGAVMIVDKFEKEGIVPGIVVDEGGAVVQNVFPGVNVPCALIGIAEKGMLSAEFTCESNGGHASSPKPHTPIGKLSAACVAVEKHPFKYHLCDATRVMFDTLARHSSFVYRMIFGNLWLFGPILDMLGKKSGGEINALMRTTCAFTQMKGSKAMNVIPSSAKMIANLRIIPGETPESALEYLKKITNNREIEVKDAGSMPPSLISESSGESWNRIADAIGETWHDAIVSPYLMVACSDSRHWGRISNKVYRFSAMALTTEERATIHGNDEHITVEKIGKCIEFYIRLIKKG